jgi:hypothetical protein
VVVEDGGSINLKESAMTEHKRDLSVDKEEAQLIPKIALRDTPV